MFEGLDWNVGSAYAFLLLSLCIFFVSIVMRVFVMILIMMRVAAVGAASVIMRVVVMIVRVVMVHGPILSL